MSEKLRSLENIVERWSSIWPYSANPSLSPIVLLAQVDRCYFSLVLHTFPLLQPSLHCFNVWSGAGVKGTWVSSGHVASDRRDDVVLHVAATILNHLSQISWLHCGFHVVQVLTLASNERIPLNNSMRLVFEIGHLKYATPATVSRAGILFVNPQDLGWNP